MGTSSGNTIPIRISNPEMTYGPGFAGPRVGISGVDIDGSSCPAPARNLRVAKIHIASGITSSSTGLEKTLHPPGFPQKCARPTVAMSTPANKIGNWHCSNMLTVERRLAMAAPPEKSATDRVLGDRYRLE